MTVGLELLKVGAALQQSGLKFFGHLDLPPGDWAVRVLVRNAATGAAGEIEVEIDELVRDGWVDCLHPEERDAVARYFCEVASRRETFCRELRIRGKGAEYHWFLAVSVPLFAAEGEFQGYISCHTDITEQKQAQHDLKAYAVRLEKSNRDLEHFATVASHDLQEPLRKVMVFSQYLQKTQEDKLTPEGYSHLSRMQNAAERMSGLVKGLLELSRVNRTGRSFSTVDLAAVLADVRADLQLRIKKTGARVEIGDMMTIDADPLQIYQLFQNLIGNAMKFHRPGVPPVITVSARKPDASCCEITVRDNGIGFDTCYVNQIFDIFTRLHSRSEYEGTGIGLAICRKIVERHGGDITAISEVGKGSTFIIRLPLSQQGRLL